MEDLVLAFLHRLDRIHWLGLVDHVGLPVVDHWDIGLARLFALFLDRLVILLLHSLSFSFVVVTFVVDPPFVWHPLEIDLLLDPTSLHDRHHGDSLHLALQLDLLKIFKLSLDVEPVPIGRVPKQHIVKYSWFDV